MSDLTLAAMSYQVVIGLLEGNVQKFTKYINPYKSLLSLLTHFAETGSPLTGKGMEVQ